MNSTSNEHQTIEELQQEKARHEAEKARLEAEKARHEAEKAAKEAQTVAEVSDLERRKAVADAKKALLASEQGLTASRQLEEIKNKTALLTARKALADAQEVLDQGEDPSGRELEDLAQKEKLAEAEKTLAEARNQAALAKYIGTVTKGPYSGSVDMQENAGAQEAKLLAARAVRMAADKLARAIKEHTKRHILVFEADSYPDFERLTAYRFRLQRLQLGFKAAGITPKADEPRGAKPEAAPVAAPAAFSAGLAALADILGHLKTDFTVKGLEVELDNSLMIYTVAGRLANADPQFTVEVPTLRNPLAVGRATTTFTDMHSEMEALRTEAGKQVKKYEDEISRLKENSENQSEEEQEAGQQQAAQLKPLTELVTAYDTLMSSMVTPDEDGNLPIAALFREFFIEQALVDAGDAGGLLLLRLENTGGGFLMKKNLLTGLGAMPLYHMGGATLAYLLMDGKNGRVIDGNVIPVHGGFVKSGHLAATLERG